MFNKIKNLKPILLLWLSVMECLFLNAQNPPADASRMPMGTVFGMVKDSLNNEAIEFATITLTAVKDNSVTGGVTNEKGKFSVENVKPGRYIVKIQAIGYNAKTLPEIALNPKNGMDLDLGLIKLRSEVYEIKGAEVRADKLLMTNAIDKKSFDVDKMAVATGGSAADIFQQLPAVDIDMDGNVTLRGSGSITVLIDGRPSAQLSGGTLQNALEQIPANSIEKIELITNPSSKYDPDGMGGIINIVLKKNKREGFNGTVNAGVGTSDKYNAGIQLNKRAGKASLFISYNFQDNTNWFRGKSDRNDFNADTITRNLIQSNNGDNRMITHSVKSGIEYSLSKKDLVYANGSWGVSLRRNSDFQANDFHFPTGSSLSDYAYNRTTYNRTNTTNYDASAGYKHDFGNIKHFLTSDFSISGNLPTVTRNFFQESDVAEQNSTERSFDDNAFRTITAAIDYGQPFGEKTYIETGLKNIQRSVNQNFKFENYDVVNDEFINNTDRSNSFDFNEYIYSAYANMGRQFGKFGVQAGLRLEQAFTRSYLVNTAKGYDNDYFSYFPSLFLKYELTEKNTLQTSVSRRIRRPSTEDLNPFPEYSDPTSLFQGNPFLKPEYTNSYEFSYSFMTKGFSVQPTLYFRQTNNSIQRYIYRPDTSEVAFVTMTNLAKVYNTGLDMNINYSPFDWWNMTFNTNLYYEKMDGTNIDPDFNRSLFTYSTKISSTWNIQKKIDIQVTSNYKSPQTRPQGKFVAQYSTDLAVAFKVFSGRGTLNFKLTDIFDTRQFGVNITDTTLDRVFRRKRESRVASVNFIWRFGSQDNKGKSNTRKPKQDDAPASGGEGF